MAKATKGKRPKMSKEQRQCVALVKRARKADWTLEEMAAHLGVSFASVSRWQRGLSVPYRNTAARLIPMLEELVA